MRATGFGKRHTRSSSTSRTARRASSPESCPCAYDSSAAAGRPVRAQIQRGRGSTRSMSSTRRRRGPRSRRWAAGARSPCPRARPRGAMNDDRLRPARQAEAAPRHYRRRARPNPSIQRRQRRGRGGEPDDGSTKLTSRFGQSLAGLNELAREGGHVQGLPLEVQRDRVGGAREGRRVCLDLRDGGQHLGVLLDRAEALRVLRQPHASQLDEAEAAQVVDVGGLGRGVLAGRPARRARLRSGAARWRSRRRGGSVASR